MPSVHMLINYHLVTLWFENCFVFCNVNFCANKAMINGISSYQNYNGTSSNSITPTSTETSSTPSNQSAEIAQSPRQENLYLSSKAQKINALNNEFFQSGISVDVSALAERAYQYGLISKSEYEQLNDTRTPENEIKEPAGTTTENLVSFTHQFQDKIDKALETPEEYEQEEKNLFATLKEALNSAAIVLKRYRNSQSFS